MRRAARHNSLPACPRRTRTPRTPPCAQVIRGAGFGHGIGMSQYGAYGYALHGRDLPADPRPTTTRARGSRARRRDRCGCCSSPTTRTSACAAPHASAGHRLKPSRTYVARASGGRSSIRTTSGKRVARVGNGARFTGSDPLRLLGPALNGVTSGRYRGAIELRTDLGGVTAINVLDLDSYVRGVVAGEMPSSWPLEALKAQAVAARTYALATRKTDGAVRPVPRHALADVPRRDRRERAQRRRRGATPPAGSSPTAARPPSPTTSPPRAGTPRTSSSRSSARCPSRGWWA